MFKADENICNMKWYYFMQANNNLREQTITLETKYATNNMKDVPLKQLRKIIIYAKKV